MATIRLKDHQWSAIRNHLYSTPGEHFAFMHAGWTVSSGMPVFIIHDISLIPDREVRIGPGGWEVEPGALIEIVNNAVRSKSALIEIHNHGGVCLVSLQRTEKVFRTLCPTFWILCQDGPTAQLSGVMTLSTESSSSTRAGPVSSTALPLPGTDFSRSCRKATTQSKLLSLAKCLGLPKLVSVSLDAYGLPSSARVERDHRLHRLSYFWACGIFSWLTSSSPTKAT